MSLKTRKTQNAQIKIFLMKSESFLTLHRQQHNYHVQGEHVAKTDSEENTFLN